MAGIGELDLREVPAEEGGAARCPLCREDLAGPVYECPDCATRYHAGCARFLSGCSTLGCPRKGQAVLDVDRRARRQGRRAISRLVFMGLMAALPGVALTIAYVTLTTMWRHQQLRACEEQARVLRQDRDQYLERLARVLPSSGEQRAGMQDALGGQEIVQVLNWARSLQKDWVPATRCSMLPLSYRERPGVIRAWLPVAVGLYALSCGQERIQAESDRLRGSTASSTQEPWSAPSQQSLRHYLRRVPKNEIRAWIQGARPHATPQEVERVLATLVDQEAPAR